MNGFSARRGWRLLVGPVLSVTVVLLSGCDSTGRPSMAAMNPFSRDKAASTTEASPGSEAIAADSLSDPARQAEFKRLMSEGKKAEESGNYAVARRSYEGMIVSFPNRHEGYYRLGVVADHEKRFREAEALFSQAIGLHPMEAKYHNSLGYCFLLQRKLGDAEAAMRKAVALQPSNGRFRTNLGMVYGHMDRYEDALEQFQHAGGVADAYCNLAFVLESQGKVPEAKNAYRIAERADPSSDRASQLLAELESYERDPRAYTADAPEYDADGMRWVRFDEQGQSGAGEYAATETTDMAGFTPMRGAGTSTRQVSATSAGSSLEASGPRVSEWGATRPLYE